jgi:uncharacterized protein (DUF4415 family)
MKKIRRAMKKHYDFSKGKRGPVIPPTGKTRVTIWLDDAILDHFRELGGRVGKGFQTLINDALRDAIGEGALTPKVVRQVARERV